MRNPTVAIIAALAALALWATAIARPFVPESDATIVERLPEAADASLAELKRLRAAAARSPSDFTLASIVARRAIDACRRTGDPRYLGYAQAALGAWWNASDAPPLALLLRATIEQSRHEFAASLADLDRLLAARPDDAQALVTRASVLTVQGRYADAQRDCRRLAPRVPPLVAAACIAGPRSLSGGADAAQRELRAALATANGTGAAVGGWALAIDAGISLRRGDVVAAERALRDALGIDPRDAYAKAALADLLLDTGRARDAAALVADDTRNDTLLLRLVLAEARLPDAAAAFRAHRDEMSARFDAARLRGDSLHAREEARFRLDVEHDARAAVSLARANWAVQREPADLRVLVDAAIAANDRAALATATDWIASTRIEDATLTARMGDRR